MDRKKTKEWRIPMTEDWRKASNKSIADNLVQSIAELLDGEVQYVTGCDKKNEWKKIVIEYEHRKKD